MPGTPARTLAALLAVFVVAAPNFVTAGAGEPAAAVPGPQKAAGADSAQAAVTAPQAAQSSPLAAVPSRLPPAPVPALSAPPEEKAPDRVLRPGEVASQVLENQKAEDAEDAAGGARVGEGQDRIPRGEEDVPPGLAGQVRKFIRYFQNAGRKKFELWLARSGKYSDLMRGILAKYGLPEDLVYLALIESGFSPKAYSVARAAGPWQFIAGTAKRYGLRIDWWTDERRDYEKSTHAAASYLKDLYGLFESWDLAAAAYNAGEGKIMKAVTRYRSEDYTDLIRGRYLQQETKDYVPKMYAALSIAKEPAKYGFGDVRLEEPLSFEKVEVPGGTDLAVLGTIIGLSADAIREWNPELRRFCTPPNQGLYELRVPPGYAKIVRERMNEIRSAAKITFLLHQVRRGETLEGLSAKYRVPVATLREMNGLRSAGIGRAKRLVIPVAGLSADEAPPGTEISPEQIESALARADEGVRRARSKTRITVRRGDTVARIAARAGVSPAELAAANGISPNAKLKKGRKLRLPPPQGAAESRPQKDAKAVRHVVRPGDTLSRIAREHGVSVARLASGNNLRTDAPLRAGQVLRISPES